MDSALVIATFLLVLITAWYAFQTKRMVDEMKDGRKLAAMPIITCDIKIDLEPISELAGEFNTILVRNDGNSPAINTTVELQLTNPDTSTLHIKSQQWFIGVVGHNKEHNIKNSTLYYLKYGVP